MTEPAEDVALEEQPRTPPRIRLEVQTVPISDVSPYPGNARRGNVEKVAESLLWNGQFRPLVVQRSTGYVLAGNHTLRAATEVLGWTEIDVTYIDVDDEHARRIVLADNRTSDLADYDDEALHRLLEGLEDLDGTGYEEEDREVLRRVWDAEHADPEDPEDQLPAKGDLLALADVAVAEPQHIVAHGSVWKIGRHWLVIARVSDEHALWSSYLEPETVFCPYPEPYLTATEMGMTRTLVMVQPNRYLAGHLLDKHEAMFPGQIEQVA